MRTPVGLLSHPLTHFLSPRIGRAVLAGIAGIAVALPVGASAGTWFGGIGNFNDPDLWNPAGVPVAGQDALIDGGTANILPGDVLQFNYLRITRGASPANATASVIQTGGDVLLTNVRVGDGNTHSGTLEMSGTSSMAISAGSGSILLGANAGSHGTMTLRDSAKFENYGTTNLRFAVGDTGTGLLTLQDSSEVTTTRLTLGNNAAGVGTVDISGSATLDIGEWLLIGRNGGSGTVTISGAATVNAGTHITLGADGGGTGTLHVNGGTVTAPTILKGAAANATIRCNGGTVRASAESFDYFGGFDGSDLQIDAGGLKFDTQTYSVTINQSLAGTGGLTKLGSGMLTLTGENTFTGFSAVSQGTLIVGSGATIGGVLDVAAGATLEVESAVSLDDSIVLTLVTDSNVILSFSGVETIGALWINGAPVAPDQYTLDELSLLSGGVNFTGDPGAVLSVTSTVPEPGTFALLGLGAALAARRLVRRS